MGFLVSLLNLITPNKWHTLTAVPITMHAEESIVLWPPSDVSNTVSVKAAVINTSTPHPVRQETNLTRVTPKYSRLSLGTTKYRSPAPITASNEKQVVLLLIPLCYQTAKKLESRFKEAQDGKSFLQKSNVDILPFNMMLYH